MESFKFKYSEIIRKNLRFLWNDAILGKMHWSTRGNQTPFLFLAIMNVLFKGSNYLLCSLMAPLTSFSCVLNCFSISAGCCLLVYDVSGTQQTTTPTSYMPLQNSLHAQQEACGQYASTTYYSLCLHKNLFSHMPCDSFLERNNMMLLRRMGAAAVHSEVGSCTNRAFVSSTVFYCLKSAAVSVRPTLSLCPLLYCARSCMKGLWYC